MKNELRSQVYSVLTFGLRIGWSGLAVAVTPSALTPHSEAALTSGSRDTRLLYAYLYDPKQTQNSTFKCSKGATYQCPS